jgi:diaminopimelate decarboxylase
MFRDTFINEGQKIPTPAYYYDMELLSMNLSALRNAANKYNYKVHYALKANYHPKILRLISNYGFGADCVSGKEIKRALETGFLNSEIAFAGVGKTDREINYAIEKGIFGLNCESPQELEVINNLAGRMGKKASVFLRINPDIEVDTHHYITTGQAENKFGMGVSEAMTLIRQVHNYSAVTISGLHFHIGSQITDTAPFEKLCHKINEIQSDIATLGVRFMHLNVGGGLGIDYEHPDENSIPDFNRFFSVFSDHLLGPPNQQVHFELGRSMVGQCGTLLSKVLYIKQGRKKTFVIIDASMTDLLRPALYGAYHKIENFTHLTGDEVLYEVVGPVCETSDTFGKNVKLSPTKRGDLLAIRSVGAYGQVMSSNYNLRARAPAIFSDETDLKGIPGELFRNKCDADSKF